MNQHLQDAYAKLGTMMFLWRAVLLITLSGIVAGCQSQSTRGTDPTAGEGGRSNEHFITVDGTHLKKGQKTYYFAGANYWYGPYLGASADGRKRMQKELDQLGAMGVTNLRILASSEKTAASMAVAPAIHAAPGEYDEALLIGLDYLLVEMAKRKMHAVLYLNNFWQWSGGMSQYVAWSTNSPVLDPDITGQWNEFMQNSASFYRDNEAQAWFQKAISELVLRVNTVNGIRYADDSTIMAWQLANEPRPGSNAEGRPFFPVYKSWLSDTAAFIKSLDPNHLVSTGSEGSMGTLGDIDLYIEAHHDPNIDYLTFHLWPKNWGWIDILKPEETFQSALTNSRAYILQHIQVARTLNKPIVLEEFGMERDHGNHRLSSTTTVRDRFYKEIYQLLHGQARLGFPIAGSNFWGWGGAGRAQSEDLIWNSGDAFTGDPPHEPQGMNSVFDVDATTIEIISQHAKSMRAL